MYHTASGIITPVGGRPVHGCLYVRNDARDPSSEMWNCEREICPVILPKFPLLRKFRDLLHAVNLRHKPTSALNKM